MLSLSCLKVSFERATARLVSSSKSAHCGHVTSTVSSWFCCPCLEPLQKRWLPHSSSIFTGVVRRCSLFLHCMHLSDKSIWQQSSVMVGLTPPFATLPPVIRMHNSNSCVPESHYLFYLGFLYVRVPRDSDSQHFYQHFSCLSVSYWPRDNPHSCGTTLSSNSAEHPAETGSVSFFSKYFTSQSNRLGSTDILVPGSLHPRKIAFIHMGSSWLLTAVFWMGPLYLPRICSLYGMSFCFRVLFTSAPINLRHSWCPAPLIPHFGHLTVVFACLPVGITGRWLAHLMCCNLAAIFLLACYHSLLSAVEIICAGAQLSPGLK